MQNSLVVIGGVFLALSCGRAKLELVSQGSSGESLDGVGDDAALETTDSASDAGPVKLVSEFDLDQPRKPSPTPCSPDGTENECPEETPRCDFILAVCVQCSILQDCLNEFGPTLPVCDEDRVCRPCRRDSECPAGWDCERGNCFRFCNDDRECPPEWQCDRGICDNDALPVDSLP